MKDGSLFCYSCGEEVRMVPDYEPELDDLEIKLSGKKEKPEIRTEVQRTFPEEEKKSGVRSSGWNYFIPAVVLFVALCALLVAYSSILKNQSPEEMLGNGQEEHHPLVRSPQFSIPGGEYGYYLTVELTADEGETIFFTMDGSTPDEMSYVYREPIELSEGFTSIRALAMDENGNFSAVSDETYTVEFGIPDAPVIMPEGGEYRQEMYVKIIVPDGCTAYYTIDGSRPDESSEIYTGEFLMPSGVVTVKAVLENVNGSFSEVSSVLYYHAEAPEAEETAE